MGEKYEWKKKPKKPSSITKKYNSHKSIGFTHTLTHKEAK